MDILTTCYEKPVSVLPEPFTISSAEALSVARSSAMMRIGIALLSTLAEPLYKRALKIYEKVLGKNHSDVAPVCENIAGLYRQISKEDEAERLEARARRNRSNQ
jgi:hypothetical protein